MSKKVQLSPRCEYTFYESFGGTHKFYFFEPNPSRSDVQVTLFTREIVKIPCIENLVRTAREGTGDFKGTETLASTLRTVAKFVAHEPSWVEWLRTRADELDLALEPFAKGRLISSTDLEQYIKKGVLNE